MSNLKDLNFNCTGCCACKNICPRNAIKIELNKEGFYQYRIDKNKCINCGLCIKICPKISFTNSNSKDKIKSYSAYSKDKKVLSTSSSGGIFYHLAKKILDYGGMVASVIFENNTAKHVLIDSVSDLSKMQGSKYIQSYPGNIYNEIKKNIKSKKILFVGTPCQCAAIRKIIDNSNLIVVDLACHGVPSKIIFDNSLKSRFNGRVNNINFRLKDKSWTNYSLGYFNGDKIVSKHKHYNDEWFMAYLKNLFLMKSCYDCDFNTIPRVGDITLSDAWGIGQIDKDFFKDNKDNGVSLVIINNLTGSDLFDSIKNEIIYKKQNLLDFRKYNPRIFNGKYNDIALLNRNKNINSLLKEDFRGNKYKKKTKDKIINKIKEIIKCIIRK